MGKQLLESRSEQKMPELEGFVLLQSTLPAKHVQYLERALGWIAKSAPFGVGLEHFNPSLTAQEMTKLWENSRVGFGLGTFQIAARIFFVQLSKTLQHPDTVFLVSLVQNLDTAADSKAQFQPGLPCAGGIWFGSLCFQVYR